MTIISPPQRQAQAIHLLNMFISGEFAVVNCLDQPIPSDPTPTANANSVNVSRATVPVQYEHSANLPALLERLDLSVLLST